MKQIFSIVGNSAPSYTSIDNPSRLFVSNARYKHIIALVSISKFILACFVVSIIHIHRFTLGELGKSCLGCSQMGTLLVVLLQT